MKRAYFYSRLKCTKHKNCLIKKKESNKQLLTEEYWRQKPMAKYECSVCGYIYDEDEGDPDSGVAPGTKWNDVPDDWVCPVCGVGKGDFESI